MARIVQKYFIDSWLLPCSLRSHRITNPCRKMSFAIFRLFPPPTTLQVWAAQRFGRVKKKMKLFERKFIILQMCKLTKNSNNLIQSQMKRILKKPLWFTVITTLCLVITLVTAIGCDKSEPPPINENKYYTLNFVGEGVDIEPQSIEHGKYATAPENPEREGSGFGGWFTDNVTFANEWDFKTDIVTQDTTLYAKWEENTLEEIILQGTKWKLIGIVDVQTGSLTELEPIDCEQCYTLTFDANDTFSGQMVCNIMFGNYEIDYNAGIFRFIDIAFSEVGCIYMMEENSYAQILRNTQSFIFKDVHPRVLHLYYNENKNYLLFKL
jgi:uncharacterized repeat protein (TIGR02543 family)